MCGRSTASNLKIRGGFFGRKVNGKASVLMELGAGFNAEFTGMENIIFNAMMYGLDKRRLVQRIKKIIEFAGIEEFIEAPVKYYSQGMYMRLAFALAIFVEPDILLVDDVLTVGDKEAQRKCIMKIFELKEAGKTIILVSHDMLMIHNLCDRVILLNKGRIIQEGLPKKVIPYYLDLMKSRKKIIPVEEVKSPRYSISSGDIRLLADKENKALRLYYKDKEITKGCGLHSAISVYQKLFSSDYAQWQVKKLSQDTLVLILDYGPLPILQVWKIVGKEGTTLEIKIEIDVNKPIPITTYNIILELQDKYKRWMTTHEQGDLLVRRYINSTGPIRLKENRVSKIVLLSENEDNFPKLFFGTSSEADKMVVSIFKQKEISEERLYLKSSIIIPKKKGSADMRKYSYFEGKLLLGKEIDLEREVALPGIVELKNGEVKFLFDQGIGRIFWRQKELTTGLGVYTSVRSLGIWYDSHQAVWQVKDKEDSKVIVTGQWLYVPISQTWQIHIIDKQLILWSVEMEIDEEVSLGIEQANLMLSPGYKRWVVPGVSEGDFLDEYTEDYDILPFRFWYGKMNSIGVLGKSLPKIIFKNDADNGTTRVIAENTDKLYQARLLQYQKSNSWTVLPGRYSYFKGIIEIKP